MKLDRKEKIKVTFESGVSISCEISFDENPKTAKALMEALPFESRAEFWGKEIYFAVPFQVGPEKAKAIVDYGDVAYWPEGPALCLFFGPTLSSPSPNIIKPYSPVNVIGKILEDPKILEKVGEGEKLKVEKI
ncbi:MAG: cyclophilin-like fold protein [Candidatus Bathyarchaeia archaeon]